MVPAVRHTAFTSPVTIREPQLLVDRSAPATPLRRWIVALYLSKHYTALVAHVGQDLHELTEGQIRDLAAPEHLHAFQAQIFDPDEIKRIAQIVRGLEEPIPACPGNTPMSTSKAALGGVPVARTFPLPAQSAVESANLLLPLSEELRRFNFTSIAERQEGLETKVHPHRARYFLVWTWIAAGISILIPLIIGG